MLYDLLAVGRCDLSQAREALLFRNLGRPGPSRYPTDTKGHFRVSNLPTKVRLVKAMVFTVVMYGCESWTVKKAECRRIDAFELVLEKTLQSPLDCKEIQPVHSKGDQSWVFIGKTDVEAESPILWPPHGKS